jgi:quercetin 2,3-dioxygenase
MPAISADTVALPRVPDPDPTTADRPVVSVTTAPSAFEGEGFPVRRAFAGVDLAALERSPRVPSAVARTRASTRAGT